MAPSAADPPSSGTPTSAAGLANPSDTRTLGVCIRRDFLLFTTFSHTYRRRTIRPRAPPVLPLRTNTTSPKHKRTSPKNEKHGTGPTGGGIRLDLIRLCRIELSWLVRLSRARCGTSHHPRGPPSHRTISSRSTTTTSSSSSTRAKTTRPPAAPPGRQYRARPR